VLVTAIDGQIDGHCSKGARIDLVTKWDENIFLPCTPALLNTALHSSTLRALHCTALHCTALHPAPPQQELPTEAVLISHSFPVLICRSNFAAQSISGKLSGPAANERDTPVSAPRPNWTGAGPAAASPWEVCSREDGLPFWGGRSWCSGTPGGAARG
jgi:hypothetical protein